MTDVVNAAVVGLGRWGKNLVNAVQGRSDRIRFVRAMVRNPGPVQDFADQQGLTLGADFDELLRDPAVHAVVLATPHSQHVPQVMAAARAGKAVFCEKPLALTHEQARLAVGACASAGVVLAVGHDKRFWPSMVALKRLVESGELGPVLHVEGNLSNENSNQSYNAWRSQPTDSPGGSLTATGIHILDAFVNLLGPVRSVQAHAMSRQNTPRLQDTMTMFFEFDGEATGVLTSIRPTPVFFRVQVFGTDGWAQARGASELEIQRSGQPLERQQFEPVDALRLELEAFADAVTGRAPFPMTPADILRTVATLEAGVQAVDQGGRVQVAATAP